MFHKVLNIYCSYQWLDNELHDNLNQFVNV